MRKLLSVLAVIFCICSVATAADLTQEAGNIGLKYVNEMLTTCNGMRYVKAAQMEEIREYKGNVSISLHEAPTKDAPRGIQWEGNFEIVCAYDHMYLKGEGWTDDPPMPLLISVRREHGQWKTTGLRKISCNKIPVKSSLSASEQKADRISVIVGSNATCGSHGGSFEAKYQKQTSEVMFGHNPNPANPIRHPLRVFDQKGEVADWTGVICPSYPLEPPCNSAITGKKVDMAGSWGNKKHLKLMKFI